jgi:M6 family metalloprotease-like protein/uncharacterized repeat protein (TIGR02543 family)
MKNFYFLLSILIIGICFYTQNLFAVIAYPYPVEYKLPDGTYITIQLKGDEKVKWAETLDGFSILINDQGYYEYAIKDDKGDMVLSGIRAFNADERNVTQKALLSGVSKGLKYSKSQIAILKQIWDIKEKEATKAFPTTGDRQLICILMGFADLSFTKTQADFNLLFNQVGYNVGGATGSVKDYYLENSYNQFNLTVDVAGPYTASYNMSYYGGSSGTDNPRPLIAEAINLADNDVNYANYDNDGDGWVDGVYVIYAGYGREAGGPVGSIWAHAWQLASPVLKDGVYLQRYSCSAELRGNSGSVITAIGVICHEFGHVLGAPDYYDTNYETGGQYQGTGQWDMMANGSWNNNGVTPAHHNGFTKVYYYNWASATVLNSGTTITLFNASENSNSFYRINTTTTNEFFFIENREKHLFDAYIPGSGMIIYHVHSNVFSAGSSNTINDTHPQMMYPVAQNATMDPTSTPSSYGTINAANCPWTGTGKTSFTDATLPSSKSWAGNNTGKPITNISRNAGSKTVTFDFMGGAQGNPTNFTALAVSSEQIDLSWVKSEGRDVLLAYNTTSTIGTPTDGVNYSASQAIPGGGTVLYAGGNETFLHSDLTPNTTYYYKIWTKLNSTPEWSTGVLEDATTSCDAIASLPFSENFNASTSLPDCWNIIDHQGNGQVWQFGTHTSGLTGTTGNYAYLNSDAYGNGNSQNSDLVTPLLNLSNYTDVTLYFNHYFLQWSGSSGTLSYSINGGSTWTQIQQWTTTSSNPASFSQVIAAVAGQENVKFKWNYTGSWGYYWDIDNIQITGTLVENTYLLTLLSNPDDISAVLTGEGDYEEGDEVNISASAVEGYTFTGWTGEAEDIALLDDAAAPATFFAMPDRDITLTATYQDVVPPTYTLTLLADPDDIGAVLTGEGDYEEGDEVNISASAVEGYTFTGWTGEAEDIALLNDAVAPATFFAMPDRDITLTATYQEVVPPTYTLTLLADPDDIGTVLTGEGDYEEGDEVNITASAVEGYTFTGWTGEAEDIALLDDAAAQATFFAMPDRDVILTANYTLIEYNVFVEIYPDEAGEVTGNGEYFMGDQVIVEADANEGYQFLNWRNGGTVISSSNPYSFEMLASDITLTAYFIAEGTETYTLTLLADPDDIGAVLVGEGEYEEGDEVNITASAVEGYTFVEWMGEAENIALLDDAAAPATFFAMPNRDITLTATYQEVVPPTYTLTLLADPDDIGAVLTGEGEYEEGDEVTITASAVEGYTFTGWTGEAEDIALLDDAAASATFFAMPDRDITLTATYQEVVPSTYTLTLLADPDDIGAVLTGEGEYEEGDEVTITASAVEGYTFTGWTGEAEDIALLDDAAASATFFAMPDRDITLTATYQEVVPSTYTLTLLADPDDIGAVLTGEGEYEEGEEVNITASAVEGYTFTGWTGEAEDIALLNDAAAPATFFAMPDRDITLTATYQEVVPPTYTLTLLADPDDIGAVLTGEGDYEEGDEVNISASAVEGYTFTGWTGEAEDIALLDDATAQATFFAMPDRDITLTANYEQQTIDTYTVTFFVRNPENSPIVGANISITGSGNLTTDATGIAIIQLPNGNYSFTVAASGYGNYSDVFTIVDASRNVLVILTPVGVETDALSTLKVFPNPFKNSITLNNANGVNRLIVTNIIGQQVMDMQLSGFERTTISTDSLPKGVYLMIFQTENGERVIKKMIKE